RDLCGRGRRPERRRAFGRGPGQHVQQLAAAGGGQRRLAGERRAPELQGVADRRPADELVHGRSRRPEWRWAGGHRRRRLSHPRTVRPSRPHLDVDQPEGGPMTLRDRLLFAAIVSELVVGSALILRKRMTPTPPVPDLSAVDAKTAEYIREH